MRASCAALFARKGVAVALGIKGLIAAAALFALYPVPALAQHQCADGPGPGETLAYRTPDSNGLAGVSFCWYVDDGQQQQQQRPPTPHPAEALARVAESQNALIAQMLKVMSDPEMIAFNNGGLWKYPSTASQCKAVYMNPQGVLAIFGPTKGFDGVAVMFQTDRTPEATTAKQIAVELEERNLATGKVQRIPFQALHDSNSVTMVYEGKFFPQVVDSVVDKARYRVLLKNKPIVEMDFHKGLEAKARLNACMRGRR